MLSEPCPCHSILIHRDTCFNSRQVAKLALVISTLLAKSPHDGDAKNSPVVAFEETGARKDLAHNTLRSTGVHLLSFLLLEFSICW